MYEILTNQKPFNGIKSIYQLINEIIENNYPPKIDCPIEECYKNLIEECWSKNPDDRPSFDEIVKRLKNDHNFITCNIEEDEYIEYIDFIDQFLKDTEYDYESVIESVYSDNDENDSVQQENEA